MDYVHRSLGSLGFGFAWFSSFWECLYLNELLTLKLMPHIVAGWQPQIVRRIIIITSGRKRGVCTVSRVIGDNTGVLEDTRFMSDQIVYDILSEGKKKNMKHTTALHGDNRIGPLVLLQPLVVTVSCYLNYHVCPCCRYK